MRPDLDLDDCGPPRLAERLLWLALPDTPARPTIVGDLRQEFAERSQGEPSRWRALWFWKEAMSLAAHYAWRPRPARTASPHTTPARKETLMRDVLMDLRYGARSFGLRPGFSLVIAVTIALAIGANNLVFSFANLLLVRPLPVGDPSTLVVVYTVDPQRTNERGSSSIADFLDWRDAVTSLEHLAATTPATHTLTGARDPVRLAGNRATASLFDTWRLTPAIGRGFLAGEDRPGAEPVVMLGHGYWTRTYGASSGVLGRTLVLDGIAHTIVGVMPHTLELGNLSLIDVWTPLTLDAGARDGRSLSVTARLKSGVAIERASAELAAVGRQLAQRHPSTNGDWTVRTVSFREAMVGRDAWRILALLFVVTGLVLVIACANVGNLLLARATTRTREMAMRAALGASRFRVVRQLVSESLLVGLAGGIGGLGVVWLAIAGIRSIDAEPIFRQVGVDRNMLIFTLVLSVAATLLYSAAPAVFAGRTDLRQALGDGGRGSTSGRWARRSRSALVVCQLALAVALVFVAGLSVRSALALQAVDYGYRPEGLLVARVELDARRYAEPDAPARFAAEVAARLRDHRGVAAFTIVERVPTLDGQPTVRFAIEGRPDPLPAETPWADRFTVDEASRSTLGVDLVAGRFFATTDTARSPLVAVVSREAARRYWAGDSPVGRRIRLDAEGPWTTIVGVVSDVQSADLQVRAAPQIYVPLAQRPARRLALLARTGSGNPATLVPAVRDAVRQVDPTLALFDVEPLPAAIARDLASLHIITGMFVGFGLVALILAATGLFGVLSFVVAQRVPEFGTRLALGARVGDIRSLVLGDALRLLGAGTLAGAGGGLLLGKVLERTLFGISGADLPSLAATLVVLALVGLLATYGPTRRATRVDPIVVLRGE